MRQALWGVGLLVILLAGCTGVKTTGGSGSGASSTTDKDGGEEKPPHNGKLFASEKPHNHLELVTEKDKPAVAYLYDASLKNAISTTAATITLTFKGSKDAPIVFKADRQDSDPAGKSSRFKSEKPLPDIKEWKDAQFTVKIDDKDMIFTED